MASDGEATVILRRLDALRDHLVKVQPVLTSREYAALEFSYDQVRSSVERLLGTRGRPYDSQRDRLRNAQVSNNEG